MCSIEEEMQNLEISRNYRLPASSHTIPLEILDELAARFLINLPEDEKEDLVRVCFQVELAHWFYLDFYLSEYPHLSKCSMEQFAAHMFRHLPFLEEYSENVSEVLCAWSEYKLSVPVYGAIIIDSSLSKVLMVQGFGKKACWNFPKGKVNQGEASHDCAVREVLEETGYDIGPMLDKNHYLEQVINGQSVRLFLVSGVLEDTEFSPKSRGEIQNIQWWDLDLLPTRLGDKTCKMTLGVKPHVFYNVIPFIKSIKEFVADKIRAVFQQPIYGLSDVLDRLASRNSDIGTRKKAKETREYNLAEKEDSSQRVDFYPEAWRNFRLHLDIEEASFTLKDPLVKNDKILNGEPLAKSYRSKFLDNESCVLNHSIQSRSMM